MSGLRWFSYWGQCFIVTLYSSEGIHILQRTCYKMSNRQGRSHVDEMNADNLQSKQRRRWMVRTVMTISLLVRYIFGGSLRAICEIKHCQSVFYELMECCRSVFYKLMEWERKWVSCWYCTILWGIAIGSREAFSKHCHRNLSWSTYCIVSLQLPVVCPNIDNERKRWSLCR